MLKPKENEIWRLSWRFASTPCGACLSVKSTVEDIKAALETGETIEWYPEDRPYPSRLVLGWRGQKTLPIVAAENSEREETIVVTAYEPDPAFWQPDFRRRKP